VTTGPRDLATLLVSVDERVRRFRAGDREAVLEDGAASEAEALAQLAVGADPRKLMEIESARIRFFECLLLARSSDERIIPARGGLMVRQEQSSPSASARMSPQVEERPGVTEPIGWVRAVRRLAPAQPLRMGFVVDIVGFGGRSARLRALSQDRVLDVTEAVLDHLGVATDDVDHQVTGDGLLVFLPAALDVPRAAPRLLRGWRDLLREDNELYADQLRLRMAVVLGPVAPGPLGFVGPPATTAGRLVDSDVLRSALVDSPNSALVVLMSDALHSFVVDPADPAFAHRRVEVKEYRADGWLWVG
jgi:hypothetical protein